MIIQCNKIYFEHQCRQNGWPVDEAMRSVRDRSQEMWSVDSGSPYYPSNKYVPEAGPGTELKKLLKMIGITSSPNCKCNAHARKMDQMEAKAPGWCEEHMDTILGWLEEQAKGRKMPFVRMAARQMVKLAIKRANKKAQN